MQWSTLAVPCCNNVRVQNGAHATSATVSSSIRLTQMKCVCITAAAAVIVETSAVMKNKAKLLNESQSRDREKRKKKKNSSSGQNKVLSSVLFLEKRQKQPSLEKLRRMPQQ